MRREDDLLITISVFNSVGVCASITYPAEKEHEKKRKYQAAKDLAKVLPVCDALPPDYTRLRSRALQDHFFRTVEPGRFYSVTSAANMKVVDVKMYHDTPETQPLQTVSLPDVAKTHFAQNGLTFHGIVVWLLGGLGHLHAFLEGRAWNTEHCNTKNSERIINGKTKKSERIIRANEKIIIRTDHKLTSRPAHRLNPKVKEGLQQEFLPHRVTELKRVSVTQN